MNELELEIEELAQTVECPICHVKPGFRCRGKSMNLDVVAVQSYSHLGRLKAARGERTTPETATCSCGHSVIAHTLRTPTKRNPARRGECLHMGPEGQCTCPGPR